MSQSGVEATQMWAMARLGRQLFERGRDREAAKLFRGLVALSSEYGYAWHMLGRISRRAGEYAKAVDCFRHHLSVELEAHESRLVLGETLYEMGRREAALETLGVWDGSVAKPESPSIRRGRALLRRWRQAQ
jgi:tetratricopeptide (TPR) repeat protein